MCAPPETAGRVPIEECAVVPSRHFSLIPTRVTWCGPCFADAFSGFLCMSVIDCEGCRFTWVNDKEEKRMHQFVDFALTIWTLVRTGDELELRYGVIGGWLRIRKML